MTTRLSISSFKKYILFLALLALSLALFKFLETALLKRYDTRDSSQKITGYQFEDMYALEPDTIDMVIIGSSHATCSYDPGKIRETLGLNAFNLGTPLQQPDTGYYLYREMIQTQKPKYLMIDVYFKVLGSDYARNQVTAVLKEMRFGVNSLGMFLFNMDRPGKGSFLAGYVSPFGRVYDILMKAPDPAFARIFDRNPNYRGSGFYVTESVISKDNYFEENYPFSKDTYKSFSKRQVKYLEKLIREAKNHGTEVILVSAPMPKYITENLGYYETIHNNIREISDRNGVFYFDFNLDYYEGKIGLAAADFSDSGHLNKTGSEKFNDYYLKIFKEMGIV